MSDVTITQRIEELLRRLRQDDADARDELINVTDQRLLVLTRRMLGNYDRLRQWEQTDDVSQNAKVRLRRALEEVSPATPAEFYGLAAEQIRRELLDMTRYYFGRENDRDARKPSPSDSPSDAPDPPPVSGPKPAGPKRTGRAGVMSPLGDGISQEAGGRGAGERTHDPYELAAWREFHEHVSRLPPAERQVVDLLWYQELSQPEAAEVLGVDVSTVKRRWRSARLLLHDKLRGWLPKAETDS